MLRTPVPILRVSRGVVLSCPECSVRDPEKLVFPPAYLLEVCEASTRHLLEDLETTAATCGPKERALSLVTPRNLGNEDVLREGPSSCNEGYQRVSFELIVKKAPSLLLALRVRLWCRLHSTAFLIWF